MSPDFISGPKVPVDSRPIENELLAAAVRSLEAACRWSHTELNVFDTPPFERWHTNPIGGDLVYCESPETCAQLARWRESRLETLAQSKATPTP